MDQYCGPRREGPAVITVGTFDGVHLGHQQILKAVNAAAGEGCVRTVITFEPHPQSVILRDGQGVSLLTSFDEKVRLLCAYGVDRTVVLKFDQHLAQLSAEAFVQEILLQHLHTRRLVIGYNHSFGRRREGNFDFLEKHKARFGLQLDVVGPFYLNGDTVSSTKIRRALESGDLLRANRFLGRPYRLSGEVIRGAGRGQQLGYPTANINAQPAGKLIPQIGVYAVAVELDGQRYPGMLSIGTRPTFGEGERTIEVHVIHYQGDLYGRTLHLSFLQRLRDEVRYDSITALKEQMDRDLENSLAAYRLSLET